MAFYRALTDFNCQAGNVWFVSANAQQGAVTFLQAGQTDLHMEFLLQVRAGAGAPCVNAAAATRSTGVLTCQN